MESPVDAGDRGQRLIPLVCVLLLGACGRVVEPAGPLAVGSPEGQEPVSVVSSGDQTPIVFVPGIKGSALADASDNLVYLTRLEAVGLSNPGLALPMRFDGDLQVRDDRQPTGILRELYIVPWLLGEEIYGPWLDALEAQPRPYYLFAYDWRRDNLETLEKLALFVKQVRARHGRPVQLIGHSMGGMLALALLARGSDDIARLALVGSPLRGGIGFLPDLHDGVSVGLSASLLGPEVVATFPSVYCFFPSTAGADVDLPTLDFYDASAWSAAKLGPYKTGRAPGAEFDTYLATALARAKTFRDLVELEPDTNVPITVVAGDGGPTLASVRHSGSTWDFASTPREPGDGRVPLERAQPRRLKYELVTTKADHGALLNDPKVISALLGP